MKKHPIRNLWLTLAITFAAFFIISATGEFHIFGYTPEKSELYSSVFKNPTQERIDTCNNDNTQATVTSRALTLPQPVDTATKSILFIGDSMLEGLYPRLAQYSKQNSHTLNVVIWYSSTSEIWGECDTLSYFINRFHPDYIFICLGANELFVKNIKEKRAGYINNIMSQIDSIPYVWIGPPNWKEDTGINDMLNTKLPAGRFFLSNGMHFDRSKDGAHPTRQSASLWMDSVVRWMPKHCSHPIRLDMPGNVSTRANKVVVLQPKK